MEKILRYSFYFTLLSGVFFLGIFFGVLHEREEENMCIRPVQTIEKENLGVISISQVSPFGIQGEVSGNSVRIVAGDEIIELSDGMEFQINTSQLYKNIQAVIPESMQYFASKKGKKFYSIADLSQLEKVRPENLIFFQTKEEAKNAGYTD